MGVIERRAREKEELRSAILDAASKLIVEEGPQNLSIRKIAEKIEYAPSTIYLYFQDKYAILANIAIDSFEELTELMHGIVEREREPISMLRVMARCYIDFGLANPSYYQVTFLVAPPEELPPDHPICVAINKAGLQAFDGLRRAIEYAMKAGAIADGDSNAVAQSVWLSLHGLTSGLIVMGNDPSFPWVPREQLVDLHVELVLRGIGAKAS